MIYIADAELDRMLLEDVQCGDLTTRALGIGTQAGRMVFTRRNTGVVSGIQIAKRLLARLDLQVQVHVADGCKVSGKEVLLTVVGNAASLHQGWKVAQNILEWCCGVADYTHQMVQNGRAVCPSLQVACTRKSIPGTKVLAMQAVLDGGAIIHRAGTAETILLFANHRHFMPHPEDWQAQVEILRRAAPEKAIIVEVDTPAQAREAMNARPDIIQLDKCTPEEVMPLVKHAQQYKPFCRLSVAGGVNVQNVATYAATGVDLIVTSAPYYSSPADIKVELFPEAA